MNYSIQTAAHMEEMMNKKPNIFKKIFNLAKASKKHVQDGFKDVSLEDFKNRIEICNNCPFQENGECTVCGCFIAKKAWWRSEDCPKDKWPKQQ